MPQVLKQEKLSVILDAAGQIFARVGYKRAMISEIAEEAGVALGTIYRYAQSKEELFELALRRELGEEPRVLWDRAVGGAGFEPSLFEFVGDRFQREALLPALDDALRVERPRDVRVELEGLIGELYDLIARYHVIIRMLDRSAGNWPELASLYADRVRRPLAERLTEYLRRRCAAGLLRRPPDVEVAARYIIETCATLAMHRRFTPGGDYTDDRTARATAVHMVAGALVPA